MSNSNMRQLIDLVETHPTVATATLDEGLMDIIKKVAPILDPIARARNHGVKEVKTLTAKAMQRFAQYMGRKNVDWDTVTWDTLTKYIAMANQLNVPPADIKQIIMDPTTRTKLKTQVTKLAGAKFPATTWYGIGKPIGGKQTDDAIGYQVAQLIVAEIMGLAVIKHLEQLTDADDNQDKGMAAWQPEAGGAKPPDPTLTGDSDTDDMAKARHAIQTAMWQIKNPAGGTP